MQKLADVSTGLAVLSVDTRWMSRAEAGQGVPCPQVLRVVALVSVSVTKLKLKCKNTCAMAFLFYKLIKKKETESVKWQVNLSH